MHGTTRNNTGRAKRDAAAQQRPPFAKRAAGSASSQSASSLSARRHAEPLRFSRRNLCTSAAVGVLAGAGCMMLLQVLDTRRANARARTRPTVLDQCAAIQQNERFARMLNQYQLDFAAPHGQNAAFNEVLSVIERYMAGIDALPLFEPGGEYWYSAYQLLTQLLIVIEDSLYKMSLEICQSFDDALAKLPEDPVAAANTREVTEALRKELSEKTRTILQLLSDMLC